MVEIVKPSVVMFVWNGKVKRRTYVWTKGDGPSGLLIGEVRPALI